MGTAQLIEIGIVLITAGAGATFLLATVIPAHILQHSQRHGRFAGLSVDDRGDATGKRANVAAQKSAFQFADEVR
jgi:hypothetical protein